MFSKSISRIEYKTIEEKSFHIVSRLKIIEDVFNGFYFESIHRKLKQKCERKI